MLGGIGFPPIPLDSKSGAGQPVEGSNPLPSAWGGDVRLQPLGWRLSHAPQRGPHVTFHIDEELRLCKMGTWQQCKPTILSWAYRPLLVVLAFLVPESGN